MLGFERFQSLLHAAKLIEGTVDNTSLLALVISKKHLEPVWEELLRAACEPKNEPHSTIHAILLLTKPRMQYSGHPKPSKRLCVNLTFSVRLSRVDASYSSPK